MRIDREYHVEIERDPDVTGKENEEYEQPEESENGSIFPEKKTKKKKSALRDFVETVAIALVIALVIRTFIFQPFYVPTTSMVPTLNVNDRIIVNEIGLRFGEIDRGDVVVFEYPLDPDLNYVKRVIALPGETVHIKQEGVYIDGEKLEEPYLPENYSYESYGPVEVPEESYFTLGDNRPQSQDSRYWGFVPEDNMVGEAVIIYWPISNMGFIE